MRILILSAFLVFLPAQVYAGSKGNYIERQQYRMGTYARVLIYGGTNEQADSAFSEIGRIEELLSDYKPDSEISRISKEAGKSAITVSPETLEVLKTAKKVAEETDGEFDPTIGALTIGVYRFGREGEKEITEEDIKRAKSLVDFRQLRLKGDSAYLEQEGMMIDLGGIGKGYAIDKAAEKLKEQGVRNGIVSLSGDIRVFESGVTMGIQNPSGDGAIAEFKTAVDDLSISTSGGYERSVTSEGKTYHHLIVPASGKPGQEFLSVTVLMKANNTLADAYATAIYVMGKEKALKFLDSRAEVGVFFVYPDGSTYHNRGFTEFTKELVVE